MITFIISLAVLILGYLFYGRFVERVFGPDDRVTPAIAKRDNVDFMVLPIPVRGANDTINDTLNDSVKTTYTIIRSNPGIQRKGIADISGKSVATTGRHLAILVKEGLIEHRDSDKTGGYYAK